MNGNRLQETTMALGKTIKLYLIDGVAAANRNGRGCWKLESGQTYADWKEAQLDQADSTP